MTTTTTLPPRTILRLSGPETMKFLHDVCTQDVASLQPGASALAAFLDDKGRVLADARITATEEGAVIDAVAEAEPGLGRAVASVAPLAGVEVESASWHALRVDGSELVAAEFEALGVLVVPVMWGGSGYDVLAPSLRPARAALLQGGAIEGDPAETEIARIASGRPAFGVDVDADTLINETPLLVHAVSMSKGCYPGQESVARVYNLGRVRRMLRALTLNAPASVGDAVTLDGEEIGRVTSAAGTVALAFVRMDAGPGTRIAAGNAQGEVTNAGWE